MIANFGSCTIKMVPVYTCWLPFYILISVPIMHDFIACNVVLI